MSWFNKKKKEDELGMPSLPELPDLPEFDAQPKLPELPPGLPTEEPSQIHSIQPPEIKPLFQNQTQPSFKKFVPSNYPVRSEPIEGLGVRTIGGMKTRTLEIEEPKIEPPQFEQKTIRKIEPIYIRLDKFETTVNSINEIHTKVREIESLLSKTKEIKLREEKELEEWEKEIQGIKSRMEFIDKNVFSKVG
ncbi:MAG: hypothetical protein PHF67_04650 [Candidatus Nanoarchaeia archaeon]|nr:hypothetical protein [Candidatus Nanoarchaeia archaeon]